MPAKRKPTSTVYFWHVHKSNIVSMHYRYNEAKEAGATTKKLKVRLIITIAEVQKRIIEAIRQNALDNYDFSNGIIISLTAIHSYLPDISRDMINEAVTQWDIKVHNEGIFIPGQYFNQM